ncbi:DUF455 family protein [Neisseriaceae bacterium PsAf]|nr:DUF455 family protein [Neisseriaceae bacterium PsAf]
MHLFDLLEKSLLSCEIEDKIQSVNLIKNSIKHLTGHTGYWESDDSGILDIDQAGIPKNLQLVPPNQVKKRSYVSVEGYAALLHSICHIEFNAINLALDAAYRFRLLPKKFTFDWLKVAFEEVYHFSLMRERLQELGFDYGDFEAHNNLWDMAYKTSYDPLVRMALVPRVLEARGLDVTPAMQKKIAQKKDFKTCEVLEIIYHDEVGHVKIGNYWYQHLANQRGLDAIELFKQLISRYELFICKGYVNKEARYEAGFSELELNLLEVFEKSLEPQQQWKFALSRTK